LDDVELPLRFRPVGRRCDPLANAPPLSLPVASGRDAAILQGFFIGVLAESQFLCVGNDDELAAAGLL